MSSINDSKNENIDNISEVIQDRLNNKRVTKEEAHIVLNMLDRFKTNPELLNALINFTEASEALDTSWESSAPSASDNNTVSSAKLARILISILF